MAKRFPHLTWLRAFEAAARHLSFTHAADELNLTQAAISKQVKLLEHSLREPLFERRARSLLLTRAGAAYLPKVQDAFDRLGAGTEEVFGNRRSEMLTVRAPVGFGLNWLAHRLPRFFAANPGVPLRVVSSVWNEEFDSGRFDLDILYGTGKWPGFRTDQLSWEEMEPLCTPEIARTLHHPDDLAGQRLLHIMGYKEGWATWLNAAGASRVAAGSGAQFDTTVMALEVAATGAGIALGRTSMSGKEIASGRLVRPFTLAVPVQEAFHLISPETGMDHPDAPVFRDWIIAEAKADRKSA
jgi:LysR family transcriptional regulator, glycine cleavage system transcriptional activator